MTKWTMTSGAVRVMKNVPGLLTTIFLIFVYTFLFIIYRGRFTQFVYSRRTPFLILLAHLAFGTVSGSAYRP